MLRNVLTLRNEMASTGRMLVLCGLGPELRRLFSDTMVDQILTIKGSVLEALRLYA